MQYRVPAHPHQGLMLQPSPQASLSPQQQISQLGQDWQNTTDPTIRAQLNARANDLRTQLGRSGGVDYNPVTGGAVQAGTGLAPYWRGNLLGGGLISNRRQPLQAITNLINSMGQTKHLPTRPPTTHRLYLLRSRAYPQQQGQEIQPLYLRQGTTTGRCSTGRRQTTTPYNSYNANLAGYNANQGTITDQLNSLLNLVAI